MTRCQDAVPQFMPASSTTAGSPASVSIRRTAMRPGSTSTFLARFLEQVFQDPGIGEVAEEHDMAVADPEDLD
jgi:hypothetical protein